MDSKKEKNIIKYLELTYGNREMCDLENSMSISGVCIYYKISKQVGFVGEVHSDLNTWFGEGRYYPQLHKWFSNKFDVEVI